MKANTPPIILSPVIKVMVPFCSKYFAKTVGLKSIKLIITCTNTCMKPTMPIILRDLSQLLGIGAPRFLRGPNVKLKASKINALMEMPLFNMKKGKSFQGTSPKTWYRTIA